MLYRPLKLDCAGTYTIPEPEPAHVKIIVARQEIEMSTSRITFALTRSSDHLSQTRQHSNLMQSETGIRHKNLVLIFILPI